MARLHVFSKTCLLYVMAVALVNAQIEYPAQRSSARLFNVSPNAGWLKSVIAANNRYPESVAAKNRFVYFDRPANVPHPLAAVGNIDDDYDAEGYTVAAVAPPTPTAIIPTTTTARSYESGKPLIVYASDGGASKWNAFRSPGSHPIQTVSAIIRAPSAKLLSSDHGKSTVLVSGPVLPTAANVVVGRSNAALAHHHKPLEVIHRGLESSESDSDLSPKPYDFSYDTTDEFNNKQARRESQDQSGRVVGFYTYVDANGQSRLVNYVADQDGFRADIKTNEHGTETSAPAAARIESVAPKLVHTETAAGRSLVHHHQHQRPALSAETVRAIQELTSGARSVPISLAHAFKAGSGRSHGHGRSFDVVKGFDLSGLRGTAGNTVPLSHLHGSTFGGREYGDAFGRSALYSGAYPFADSRFGHFTSDYSRGFNKAAISAKKK